MWYVEVCGAPPPVWNASAPRTYAPAFLQRYGNDTAAAWAALLSARGQQWCGEGGVLGAIGCVSPPTRSIPRNSPPPPERMVLECQPPSPACSWGLPTPTSTPRSSPPARSRRSSPVCKCCVCSPGFFERRVQFSGGEFGVWDQLDNDPHACWNIFPLLSQIRFSSGNVKLFCPTFYPSTILPCRLSRVFVAPRKSPKQRVEVHCSGPCFCPRRPLASANSI